MKHLIRLILLVTILVSCRSYNISCDNRYDSVIADITEVNKCYVVLSTQDTLYNTPKSLRFSLYIDGTYKLIYKEQWTSNCILLQKDLIDAKLLEYGKSITTAGTH